MKYWVEQNYLLEPQGNTEIKDEKMVKNKICVFNFGLNLLLILGFRDVIIY